MRTPRALPRALARSRSPRRKPHALVLGSPRALPTKRAQLLAAPVRVRFVLADVHHDDRHRLQDQARRDRRHAAKLQIWDTAGQERFRTITVSHFKGAHGIVPVYDITDRDTLESIRQWVEQIHEYADASVNVLLVGNKCDQEEQRAVQTAEGDALAREYGIDFFETSARENVNVEECYLAIARKTKARLLESEEAAVELRETITVAPEQSEKDRRKKKCAC